MRDSDASGVMVLPQHGSPVDPSILLETCDGPFFGESIRVHLIQSSLVAEQNAKMVHDIKKPCIVHHGIYIVHHMSIIVIYIYTYIIFLSPL